MDRSVTGSAQTGGFMLGGALVVGLLVRALPLAGADFPLGDGGLFASVITDIRANGLLPPAHITYNQAQLPFAYPPLSLEIAATIGTVTGIATVDLLHWLPFVFSVATIPACFILALAVTQSRATAGITTIAFAVVPRSYAWLIVGGGLTRSLGLLFALLALWQLVVAARTQSRGAMLLAGLLGGLTVLSHLSAAVFFAFSAMVFLYRFRHSVRWLDLLLSCGFGALVIAPWLLFVVVSHGPGPLVAASGSRLADLPASLSQLPTLRFTDEYLLAPVAVLGGIGVLISAFRGPRWLLVWLIGPFFLVSGDATTYAMVPWAFLTAVACEEFLAPLTTPRGRPAIALTLVGLAVVGSAWTIYHDGSPLRQLPPAVRAAMREAHMQLDHDARVLVVSGIPWGLDAAAEWFPFIAERRSVATAQGQEFSSDGGWAKALAASNDLQHCATRGLTCLDHWALESGARFSAVFLPAIPSGDASVCCALLRAELTADPNWITVFDSSGGLLVTRKEPEA